MGGALYISIISGTLQLLVEKKIGNYGLNAKIIYILYSNQSPAFHSLNEAGLSHQYLSPLPLPSKYVFMVVPNSVETVGHPSLAVSFFSIAH